MCGKSGSDWLYWLLALVLVCLFAFGLPETTFGQTSELPKLGELLQNSNSLVMKPSDDLVKSLIQRSEQLESLKEKSKSQEEELVRLHSTLESFRMALSETLTKRIEQLESLKAKSNAQEQELTQLHSTLESLLTTLSETSKSRDEFKAKYEEQKTAVADAKKVLDDEVAKVRAERDAIITNSVLAGAVGLPAGVFIGGWACSGDYKSASFGAIGVALIEVAVYGVVQLYKIGIEWDKAEKALEKK